MTGRRRRPRTVTRSGRVTIGRRRAAVGAYRESAARRLRKFRKGTLLAVALTGLFLMLWGRPAEAPAQETPVISDTMSVRDSLAAAAADSAHADSLARNPALAVEEATSTVRVLAIEAAGLLPKILLAALLLIAAAVLTRIVRAVLRRVSGRWEKGNAASAMAGVVIWLLAVGIALSIVMGDARALVGSVGLLGLALSWALQSPIESFAGWLLNSFKGYYRIGDRIEVGEVFGDVYRIEVLNTTVWEAGGPDKSVHGAQPTGALITFPNSEVLRANIVNYTRYFAYVWDEVTIAIANESDLRYALEVVTTAAQRIMGEDMRVPVEAYRQLLRRQHLAYDVSDEPQVYVTPRDSWTDVTVRYLVGARDRRTWSTRLYVELTTEVSHARHQGRIMPAYPVRRIVEDGT